jgi:hypothetical protein
LLEVQLREKALDEPLPFHQPVQQVKASDLPQPGSSEKAAIVAPEFYGKDGSVLFHFSSSEHLSNVRLPVCDFLFLP